MKKKITILYRLFFIIGIYFLTITQGFANFPANIQLYNIPSLATILEKTLPAIVNIHIEGLIHQRQKKKGSIKLKYFLNKVIYHKLSEPVYGIGSGVIIDAVKGYILTNNHVVNHAHKIRIQLNNGEEYPAKLIGKDKNTDIAVIQVSNAKHLKQMNIANSDHLKVGDFVLAIGHPFGLNQTVTSGIISALSRDGLNLEKLENFIQTDAAINQGNSGGALINLNGELIGINTAILSSQGGNIGIGFAVPSNMAMNLVKQLIKFGTIKSSMLGIRGIEMNSDLADAFHSRFKKGVLILEVIPQSAAAKSGIKSGDIIIKTNEKRIFNFAQLRAIIATTIPQKTIKIHLIRKNKFHIMKVILDARLSQRNRITYPKLQGATFSNGTTIFGDKGIHVDSVDKNTPAKKLGLQKNDIIITINYFRTNNIAQMKNILQHPLPILIVHIIRYKKNIYLMTR